MDNFSQNKKVVLLSRCILSFFFDFLLIRGGEKGCESMHVICPKNINNTFSGDVCYVQSQVYYKNGRKGKVEYFGSVYISLKR